MIIILRILCLSLLFSSLLRARPDVFFVDSDHYDGAYLRHEFNNNNNLIKFILTKAVADINLPNDFFDYHNLDYFIKNIYIFPSAAMKRDFIRMMSQSFESRFTAQDFLKELLKVLKSL
jgi:hypothetical protein